MALTSHRIDLFGGRYIELRLFSDVTNASDLRAKLVAAQIQPECSLINATMVDEVMFLVGSPHPLVPTIYAVQLAALQAVTAQQRSSMRCRTLHAELVFTLAATKQIGDSLTKFGINDETKHVLLACFDATEEQMKELCGLVQGTPQDINTLSDNTNEEALKKVRSIGRSLGRQLPASNQQQGWNSRGLVATLEMLLQSTTTQGLSDITVISGVVSTPSGQQAFFGSRSSVDHRPWASTTLQREALIKLGTNVILQVMTMPALSPTMEAGTIAQWYVAEGDSISEGQVLADVETDKATVGFETTEDGVVAKRLVPAGTENVAVNSPVLVVVDDAAHVAAFKEYTVGPGAAPPATPVVKTEEGQAAATVATAPSQAASVKVSDKMGPAARKYLAESRLSPGDITPTGPSGIITKGDILAAVASGVKPSTPPTPTTPAVAAAPATPTPPPKPAAPAPAAAPAPPSTSGAGYTDSPTSNIRRVITKRLVESKTTIPAVYVRGEVDLDPVNALREQLKAGGKKVSVNDFVVRGCAVALRQVPVVNATWDTSAEAIKYFDSVDISIAVATEGGLITPIVPKADEKSLAAVSMEVKDLAGRARANKLKPHEYQGGSFTVSNLGMFGMGFFQAIINMPQGAILAIGAGRDKVSLGPDGQPQSKQVMDVCLSADRRAISEEDGAQFLEALQKAMANPGGLL